MKTIKLTYKILNKIRNLNPSDTSSSTSCSDFLFYNIHGFGSGIYHKITTISLKNTEKVQKSGNEIQNPALCDNLTTGHAMLYRGIDKVVSIWRQIANLIKSLNISNVQRYNVTE